MVIELRAEVVKRLTPPVMDRIRKAPKPTKVAEALAVTKEFKGVALSVGEIAEIINIAEPGREEKAIGRHYDPAELGRHPDLLLIRTPGGTFVRYAAGLRL